MVLVTNDDFLIKLAKLAQSARVDSSFTVTIKRYDGHDKPTPREDRPQLKQPNEYKCLVRARCKSKKLATVVSQNDVPRIMEMYAKFMKTSMDGLKKVKKVKSKAKAAQG